MISQVLFLFISIPFEIKVSSNKGSFNQNKGQYKTIHKEFLWQD
jgi:hypothetical protein